MTAQLPADEELFQIGQRIREIRKNNHLTLKQLGERTGLSIPYLSQIENGRVELNITNLQAISSALKTPLVQFFVNGTTSGISITRRSERRWYDLVDNASESLLVKTAANLEIFSIRLKSHSSSTPINSHQGEEFTYVLRGSVKMLLNDDQVYEIEEGDIIYYLSSIPHRWQNDSPDEAEILVVNTPATY